MTQLEYRNRSISQLVNQLNSLGEAQVVLEPIKLMAIHQYDHEQVKRFKNSHGQQFFTVANNDKRFIYDNIQQEINHSSFDILQELYEKRFNVTMMMTLPKQQNKSMQLWGQLNKWIKDGVYCALGFSDQHIVDLVSQEKLTERQIETKAKYYHVKANNSIAFFDKMTKNNQAKDMITIMKVKKIFNDQPTPNQLTLVILPQKLFNPQLKASEYLSTIKSQLTQIFNFIKLNPAKKYQHFSKLLTKRMTATNIIAALVLEQSMCMVINWVNQGKYLTQRLAFFDKLKGLQTLLKVEKTKKVSISQLPYELNSGSRKQASKSKYKQARTDRTPVAQLTSQQNQLEYCRSFERKTHKYSIHGSNQQIQDTQQLFSKQVFKPSQPSQFQLTTNQHSPSPVLQYSQRNKDIHFDETLPKQNIPTNMNESQQISILKAQHAVEVSQYHHTIQQLNKKILALTQQNKLEQLYTIHERQLMLLELKIKQLRKDISILTEGSDDKSYKSMIRKLNEEIKRLENNNAQKKVAAGKINILEKQLQEYKNKYQQSQKSRKKLTYQLDYLTKRLKICDDQIEHLNQRNPATNANGSPVSSTNKLSISDIQSLRQIQILINQAKQGNEQACKYLMRKLTNVLEDLSSSRNIILECNDFLVQLQEHLEQKLGGKQPQIVLDCNKFIRNFLMDNLNIF